MSGYSTPDCSVPDLCSASNIRLIFSRSCADCHSPISSTLPRATQVLIQIEKGSRCLLYSHRALASRLSFRFRGQHHIQAEVSSDLLHDLGRDAAQLPRISLDQCILTKRVDQPRIAPRLPVEFHDGFHRKRFSRVRASCDLQAPIDVPTRLIQIEGAQVRMQRNSLLQLPQVDRIELLVQFLLSHKKNLQQLRLPCLKVRQEPNFSQHIRRKVVGLVDYQNRGTSLLVTANEVTTQIEKKIALRLASRWDAEVPHDILQKLHRTEARVKDISECYVSALQYLQQAAHEYGLARAHFAGQHDESLAPLHPVIECCQRFIVLRRRKQKCRIRRDVEGVSLQIVETLVHGWLAITRNNLKPQIVQSYFSGNIYVFRIKCRLHLHGKI